MDKIDMYDDIVYLDNGIEIIPAWKQCGDRNPNWSDDEKWLWDSGGFTQHMLFINSNDMFVNKQWCIWEKYERGYVRLEEDGTYTAHLHIEMTRSEVYGFKTVEEAARRVAVGRHTIDQWNTGPLFVTKDGKYYDLNGDNVKIKARD